MIGIALPSVGELVKVPEHGPGVVSGIDGGLASILLDAGGTAQVALELLEVVNAWAIIQCDKDKGGCGQDVEIDKRINQGQVAVVVCDNCGESWSVYSPPLEQYRTDKFEAIWPIIGQ
jgi:hypothetical protein